MKNSLKTLLMVLVTAVATIISNNGALPQGGTEWLVTGITALGVMLTWAAKNFIFPSVSITASLDLRDLLSGVVLAVGTAVSNYVGTVVAGVGVDWHKFWSMIISVAVMYLIKTFASPASNNLK